jgi:pyruvate/2-oxoglutarate/acetoin dehydrogenase E1 component
MATMTFAEAINLSLTEVMSEFRNVVCYGLGTTDPKGIFGTTLGLEKKFGSERVFDMPTSENAMTGVAIGAALGGFRPVMTHQRVDFFLLALDQLVNGAAKWFYMFGGQISVPITIRLIVGRGWGQGPTHSQNLHSWFAHIPGLKVVIPTTPYDAKGLLRSSILDPNPVVFIEHRWLHGASGDVPLEPYVEPIGKAKKIKQGKDLTIVAMSYAVVEALKAAQELEKNGISSEVIDLRSVKPIDYDLVESSVQKTGRCLVVDTGFETCSLASELVAFVSSKSFVYLKCAPEKLAMPDVPEPTSYALTKGLYLRAGKIFEVALRMMNKQNISIPESLIEPSPHDIPGDWFRGPF